MQRALTMAGDQERLSVVLVLQVVIKGPLDIAIGKLECRRRGGVVSPGERAEGRLPVMRCIDAAASVEDTRLKAQYAMLDLLAGAPGLVVARVGVARQVGRRVNEKDVSLL